MMTESNARPHVRHAGHAVNLIVDGVLHATGDDTLLPDVLRVILLTCSDWAENFQSQDACNAIHDIAARLRPDGTLSDHD